jgi:ankyrin repeat protein
MFEAPFEGVQQLPPLHVAVWVGDVPEARRLLAARADINSTASWTTDTSYGSRYSGVTALHIAADVGGCNKEMLEVLLRAGADYSLRFSAVEMGYHMGDGCYTTALELAQRHGECAVRTMENTHTAQMIPKPSGSETHPKGSQKLKSSL